MEVQRVGCGPKQVDDDYLTVSLLAAGLASIVRRRKRAGERALDDGDGLLPAA